MTRPRRPKEGAGSSRTPTSTSKPGGYDGFVSCECTPNLASNVTLLFSLERYGQVIEAYLPADSDVLYVERLIAPGIINTMPDKTPSFAGHGNVRRALAHRSDRGRAGARAVRRGGARPRRDHLEPEREGVRSFCDSYDELLDCVESKARAVAGTPGGARAPR